jgi:hypothetical protein
MRESRQFFIDVVNSMPLDSEWFIQAPDEEFLDAIKEIPHEIDEVYIRILLKDAYRSMLADISSNDLHECIHQVKIFWKQKKIFEAYDGFVIGTVSENFDLAGTALEDHLDQDILFISSEW